MDKDALRKQMLSVRSSLSALEAQRKARAATDFLFASDAWKKAPAIAIFVSFRDEFPTRPIIERAWQEGKEVVTPKVADRKNRVMNFIPITSWADLQEGYMGIPEPVSERGVELSSGTLMLMPGLAFDKNGWRLGYGGGFYDTYLSALAERPLTLGLAYEDQIVDAVPHDHFDVPIDGIASDGGIIWIHK